MAQCPNCGGFRTNEETVRIHPSGREANDITGSAGCLALIAIGCCVVGGVTLSSSSMYLAEGLIAILVGIIFFALIPIAIKRRSGWPLKKSYSCLLCGYHWYLDPGQQQPEVTVRPDLIARGEQRLDAERQQIARQQAERQYRMAEENYWHQQRNK